MALPWSMVSSSSDRRHGDMDDGDGDDDDTDDDDTDDDTDDDHDDDGTDDDNDHKNDSYTGHLPAAGLDPIGHFCFLGFSMPKHRQNTKTSPEHVQNMPKTSPKHPKTDSKPTPYIPQVGVDRP